MSAREPMAKDPIGLARDNWVTHGWEDAADGMHLVTSIMRVQQAYLGQIEAILRPSGLTFARFEVLRLLAFSRLGSLPVGKVGERLQVHPASVTNAVQRLEADGLVFRRTNPSDGRGVLAEITPSGRRLVDKCTHELNAKVFTMMPISRADQRRTSAALTEIRQSFGDFRRGTSGER